MKITLFAVSLLLASSARAECVWTPFRTPITNVPADTGRIYLDGTWYRDFRWGLWPGQRDTVYVCGRSNQVISMRYVKGGVESSDASLLDETTNTYLEPPYLLSSFDTPTERTLKFIAEKCRGGCGFDVNTDGLVNAADQAVLELVVQGKLR